ncbi:hypothetical protein LY474_05940 [Myxococcus stipitatus]|uniref:hypothetical protein n=1 Tax=Myxococcus stipitatus TaxID=83455 RepID=UPI001F215698|nr:hypothetical protein [Myxococcus stipitatus]MCE9667350.1 hypothetical protein [Myxococcus stipitatus]
MSFASRLEGLLHQVGLGGVVEEVRSRLGYPRETPPSRNGASHPSPIPPARREAVPVEPASPPPPREQEPTVAQRTPRPRSPEPTPIAPVLAEAPAKAKKARGTKKAKATTAPKAAAPKAEKRASRARTKPGKRTRAPAQGAGAASSQDPGEAVGQLVAALRAHPRHEQLVVAGKLKDQLVRSLIPLYLAHAAQLDLEVTSGTTSRFWGELGVTYAAPNAAKALRLHAGYAHDTKKGKAITPKGVQYVEEALERLRADAAS